MRYVPVQALRLFPGLVIVPTMQISWTLFSILSGMMYFEEYRAMSPLGAVMCSLGVAVRLAAHAYDESIVLGTP